MPDVLTVTGGKGHSSVALNYDASDRAFMQANSLAGIIDAQYGGTTASIYGGGGAASPYLIVPSTALAQWASMFAISCSVHRASLEATTAGTTSRGCYPAAAVSSMLAPDMPTDPL